MEADEHRALVGRAHDHVADRRRLVVDEAELGLELRDVEGARADQADLLLRREHELDAGVRPALLDDPPRGLDHRHDGRLVVRAEDRPAGVADDAVLADDGLERPLRRHRVEVSAEEDRRPAGDAARQAAEQVPDRRADRRPASSSSTSSPSARSSSIDAVGDRALLARRARDRGELEEERAARGWQISAERCTLSKVDGVAEPLIQATLLGEALDNGPVAVFVVGDDFRYIAVNQYACTSSATPARSCWRCSARELAPELDLDEQLDSAAVRARLERQARSCGARTAAGRDRVPRPRGAGRRDAALRPVGWPVDGLAEPRAARRRCASAALERGADELAEERRRPRRARLELRVELARDEPRVIGQLDDLDEPPLLERP